MEHASDNICELKERIARVEEKIQASKEALELARSALSRNSLISMVTIVIAIIALAKGFIK